MSRFWIKTYTNYVIVNCGRNLQYIENSPIKRNHQPTSSKTVTHYATLINIGRTTRVATNLRSYFVPLNLNYVSKDPNANWGQELHCQRRASAHDHHSHWGSCWADSKAALRFRTQWAQFDTGTPSHSENTLSHQLLNWFQWSIRKVVPPSFNPCCFCISECLTQAVFTASDLRANWRLPENARLWTGTQ